MICPLCRHELVPEIIIRNMIRPEAYEVVRYTCSNNSCELVAIELLSQGSKTVTMFAHQ